MLVGVVSRKNGNETLETVVRAYTLQFLRWFCKMVRLSSPRHFYQDIYFLYIYDIYYHLCRSIYAHQCELRNRITTNFNKLFDPYEKFVYN